MIQSLWVGSNLSSMEKKCIHSFCQFHEFHLYVYSPIEFTHNNLITKDAREIYPENEIFRYNETGGYGGFANFFRYKLLYLKGGYWVDMDMICIKPFPENEYVFCSERMENGSTLIGNCVIKAPANCLLLKDLNDECMKFDKKTLKFAVSGPLLMQKLVKKHKLESYVYPPEIFCEINWWNYNKFLTNISINNEVIGIHLWNEMWRRNNQDKESKNGWYGLI